MLLFPLGVWLSRNGSEGERSEPQRSAATAKAGADAMPAMVRYGQAENILRQRQEVLDVAYQPHPERFVGGTPKPPL